jgi:hypothetical protein
MWKLAGGAALAILIMLSAWLGSRAYTKGDGWDDIVKPYSLSIIRWEFENLPDKWVHRAAQVFHAGEQSEQETIRLVEDYLAMSREISSIEASISRQKSDRAGAGEQITDSEEELVALRTDRDSIEDDVEETLEGQISEVLAEEGLGRTLRLGGEADLLFPPVDFKFDENPNLLIISNRSRIGIADTALLRPDIGLEDMLQIEDSVELLGFSALVERIGGVAAYPSIVPQTASLSDLLSKIAHEWFHH